MLGVCLSLAAVMRTGNAIRRRLSSEMGVAPAIAPFRGYAQHRLEQGVTSVQVMATNQKLSDLLEKVFVEALTPLRLRIMRFPMPAEDALDHERLGAGEEKLTPLICVAGVKWVLDGTPIEELAYQTKDYADRQGWRGRTNFSTEFIDAQLKIALTGRDPSTTAFRSLSATSLRTVFRSIGELFWKTSNTIGRPTMTILMLISCVRESAVMRPRDPVMRGGDV